jgi:predicted amidohydrolase YtcJ
MGNARLWHNARIFTGRRWAEALLIEAGRVVAVGSAEEARRAAPTGTEVTDLAGHLIVPGLIDAHLHLSRVSLARETLDVSEFTSLAELTDGIRRRGEERPGQGVLAHGWRAEQFGPGVEPVRSVLDNALADRAVVVYHSSGHAAAANSAALAAIGLGPSTADPVGGRIGRDREGEPNGILYETALRFLDSIAGDWTNVGPDSLHRTLRIVTSLGLTTVASMNVASGESGTLRALRDEGRLAARVRLYVRREDLAAVPRDLERAGDRSGRLSIAGFKGFTDGAFGPHTAWLTAPYADAPDSSGLPAANGPDLAEAVREASSLGLAPALHAIGDAAVLHALHLLRPATGRNGAPARLEHASLTPPEVLGALDEVRPALVVQPGFIWSDHWLRERLGGERCRWAYAFRTLADRGHLLAGSSDAPYDPIDPWRGLRATVSRRDPLGRSANPETGEALPIEEALRMYTVNGGRALGEPDLGHLEPGAWADLLVLGTSDLPTAFSRGAASIRETWVGGGPVYQSSDISEDNP